MKRGKKQKLGMKVAGEVDVGWETGSDTLNKKNRTL